MLSRNRQATFIAKNAIVIGQYIWARATSTSDYWLTRFVFLRLLGLVYLFAFLTLVHQGIPLIGENGLLPAENFLEAYGAQFESKLDAFIALPSLFWVHISDSLIIIFAWLGVALSLVIIIGFANAPLLFIIWALYMSFVHIGQIWYGFGWETQLLETSFLAIFLVPLIDPRPFPRTPPPVPIVWLLRWLTFRIYMGAGLIKIRGDECWRELSCLFYHYETQPIPNPLSPLFHYSSKSFHVFSVLWTHITQLVAPFFIFWTATSASCGRRYLGHSPADPCFKRQLFFSQLAYYPCLYWLF